MLEHGQYIMGPEVGELEARLASYTGSAHCVTCASGTEALLIALMALDVQPGDEVTTTALTFVATAEVNRAGRGKARVRGRGTGHLQYRRAEDRSRHHAAHTRHHAGCALRPVRRHGRDQRDRRTPSHPGDRGRCAKLRRDVQTSARAAISRRSGARASSRASRSAATATAARSSRTTRRSPGRCARSASTANPSATCTRASASADAWTRFSAQCVLAKFERFDWEVERRAEIGARYDALLRGVKGVQASRAAARSHERLCAVHDPRGRPRTRGSGLEVSWHSHCDPLPDPAASAAGVSLNTAAKRGCRCPKRSPNA